MKRYLFAGLLILLVIGAGIYFYTHKKPQDTAPPGSLTLPQGQNSAADTRIGVYGSDGSIISVNNFIIAETTIADQENKGQYYIAESTTTCYPDCTSKNKNIPYNILFNSDDGSFTITILREPLGAGRIAAEQYLKQVLSISDESMCALRYTMTTTTYVNSNYGGTNLGFSFCPGAVKLP